MKILIVGGSGMVGTFIYPYVSKHHEIKILDILYLTFNIDYLRFKTFKKCKRSLKAKQTQF